MRSLVCMLLEKKCDTPTKMDPTDNENVLEREIMLKGRIYGIVVLTTAAKLYFNKNIKYVIHRWRHKEVKHGERE